MFARPGKIDNRFALEERRFSYFDRDEALLRA